MTNIIFLACAAAAFALSLVHHVHMFQLDGYHRDAHIKRAKENAGSLCAKYTFSVIAFILSFFKGDIFAYISAFLMVLTAYAFIPRIKAKKALVYTLRVKRMMFTAILLFAIIALLSGFCPFGNVNMTAAVILSDAIMLLSDIINSPLEKGIKRKFIKSAERMLRERRNLTVIGITGSYGKTSTKYFLTKMLECKYNVLMTPASYNTPMGVVKTIREHLSPKHEIFVCEMGAKYKGDIKEICDIVHPDIAMITSVGPQHLESFKTIDAVISTKFELADAIRSDSKLYLNYDNEYIRNRQVNNNVVSYGVENSDAQCKATITSISDKGTQFDVYYKGQTYSFTTKLLGNHNIQNLAGCIALCFDMDIDYTELKIAVSRLESVEHRLQMLDAGANITIIDDAFNANPTGTHEALRVMSKLCGMKIIVTPGMIELGVKQKQLNAEFGRECAEICDYVFLVGGKIADEVYEGASKGNIDSQHLKRFATVQQAVDEARKIPCDTHKYILLENDLPDNY